MKIILHSAFRQLQYSNELQSVLSVVVADQVNPALHQAITLKDLYSVFEK
jgi:hypothetical protein